MTYTITKTRDAAPVGIYIPTAIDAEKAAADFRLVAVVGRKIAIVWRDGREEMVTQRRLDVLYKSHSSAVDF